MTPRSSHVRHQHLVSDNEAPLPLMRNVVLGFALSQVSLTSARAPLHGRARRASRSVG